MCVCVWAYENVSVCKCKCTVSVESEGQCLHVIIIRMWKDSRKQQLQQQN